jgi:hypothetical protein
MIQKVAQNVENAEGSGSFRFFCDSVFDVQRCALLFVVGLYVWYERVVSI